MNEAAPAVTCANHPGVEATLRCNRCEKPICTRCAVLTPTGYRCRECVRGQQKVFDTAQWIDYPVAIGLAGILAFLGSLIVPRLGFFTIFLAPAFSVLIAEAIRFAIRRRRSKRLFQLAAGAAILGSLIPLLPYLLSLLTGGGFGNILFLVWQAFFTFSVASTLYVRLQGIQIR